MACACKANKDLHMLHQKYGHKIKPSYGEKINFYTIEKIKELCALIIILLCTPLLFLYVMYITFFTKDRKISIKKLFGLRTYAGK